MSRKHALGEYPPTGQERVILKLLRSRRYWDINDLLSELSKGRAQPMTHSSLTVHMCNLRRKGFIIERRTVYSICRPTLSLAVEKGGAATSDARRQGLENLWARLLDAAMSFDRELARALDDGSGAT